MSNNHTMQMMLSPTEDTNDTSTTHHITPPSTGPTTPADAATIANNNNNKQQSNSSNNSSNGSNSSNNSVVFDDNDAWLTGLKHISEQHSPRHYASLLNSQTISEQLFLLESSASSATPKFILLQQQENNKSGSGVEKTDSATCISSSVPTPSSLHCFSHQSSPSTSSKHLTNGATTNTVNNHPVASTFHVSQQSSSSGNTHNSNSRSYPANTYVLVPASYLASAAASQRANNSGSASNKSAKNSNLTSQDLYLHHQKLFQRQKNELLLQGLQGNNNTTTQTMNSTLPSNPYPLQQPLQQPSLTSSTAFAHASYHPIVANSKPIALQTPIPPSTTSQLPLSAVIAPIQRVEATPITAPTADQVDGIPAVQPSSATLSTTALTATAIISNPSSTATTSCSTNSSKTTSPILPPWPVQALPQLQQLQQQQQQQDLKRLLLQQQQKQPPLVAASLSSTHSSSSDLHSIAERRYYHSNNNKQQQHNRSFRSLASSQGESIQEKRTGKGEEEEEDDNDNDDEDTSISDYLEFNQSMHQLGRESERGEEEGHQHPPHYDHLLLDDSQQANMPSNSHSGLGHYSQGYNMLSQHSSRTHTASSDGHNHQKSRPYDHSSSSSARSMAMPMTTTNHRPYAINEEEGLSHTLHGLPSSIGISTSSAKRTVSQHSQETSHSSSYNQDSHYSSNHHSNNNSNSNSRESSSNSSNKKSRLLIPIQPPAPTVIAAENRDAAALASDDVHSSVIEPHKQYEGYDHLHPMLHLPYQEYHHHQSADLHFIHNNAHYLHDGHAHPHPHLYDHHYHPLSRPDYHQNQQYHANQFYVNATGHTNRRPRRTAVAASTAAPIPISTTNKVSDFQHHHPPHSFHHPELLADGQPYADDVDHDDQVIPTAGDPDDPFSLYNDHHHEDQHHPHHLHQAAESEDVNQPTNVNRMNNRGNSSLPHFNDGRLLGQPPRKKASAQARDVLMNWLVKNEDHPYPTKKEKLDLSKQSGLTVKQIVHWMSNMRKRRMIPLLTGRREPSSMVDLRFLEELQVRRGELQQQQQLQQQQDRRLVHTHNNSNNNSHSTR